MKSLLEILFNETDSLREQFLQRTREWAVVDYKKYSTMAYDWNQEDWCKFLNITPVNQRFPKGFYNTKEARTYDNALNKATKIANKGVLDYTLKCVKEASEHYTDSILKLAFRIEQKGLDQNNISVKTAHIGVNIETVLTDGTKQVKAFTVLAYGEVQRPHYRYLIK